MNSEKIAFWDKHHSNKNKYWLTGSNPPDVIKNHRCQQEFIKANTFLDIGVGLGNMSRYVKKHKKNVIACDISDVALNRVKNIANSIINMKDLEKGSHVDLCICHLVFQHCNDETVREIINKVKLTLSGIFSFQFACLRDGEDPSPTVMDLLNNKTHYLRNLEEMKKIISESNKKLVDVTNQMDFYGKENLRWYFCKVTNK